MGSSKALQTKRYRAFLTRLRQAREQAGLTQEQVATRLGRPQTWVSKCELGERRVDFVELEDWAAACGQTLAYFSTRRG
jgi:transcriptional regulator with XRE-family HTH domain